mgnify:CR=1 FL=1
MYILRSLYLLWLIPRSWIDAVLVRKKPFAQRYACMKKWSERLLSHYRVTLDVQFQEQLPKDQPILFVCNHQSEFDMLLQMLSLICRLPLSPKGNEKVPYVAACQRHWRSYYLTERIAAVPFICCGSRKTAQGEG